MAEPLVWRRAGRYHEITECRRYTVAVYGSAESGWTFMAWLVKKPASEILLASINAQDCRDLCADHAGVPRGQRSL